MSVGERLRQVRKARGLTLEKLGSQVGVTKQAISKYEKGLDMPGSNVLRRLAQALAVRIEFFFRPGAPIELKSLHFRKHSRLPKKEENAVLARVEEWLERYIEAEELLFPDKEHSFAFPKQVPRDIRSLEDAEEAASALREAWELGLDPIENLMEVLEDKGIKVCLVDVSDEHFDALTFVADDSIPVVAVKRDVPGDRQRFSLAHELAHLALRPSKAVDEEDAANRFAGAFLVPESAVFFELGQKRRFLDARELYLLKHKYGLSMAGWIHRADDLQIISKSVSRRLYMHFSKMGWRKQEPGMQMFSEEPRRMEKLAMHALAEDLVSESRAAELLGKRLWELREDTGEKHDEARAGR
ncbi:MAG: ImmA/IrrE family metallo-endopeptidase [Planctomycetes bacterium]|nr:ImmA/IrrE family metallo-endopeptidase [Planctomycetota bacterium]